MTHIYFCRRNPKTYIATRRAASEEPEGTVRLYTNSASGGVFLSPDDARALAEQLATESYEAEASISKFRPGDRVFVLPPGEIPDLPGVYAAYSTGTVTHTFSDGSYAVMLDIVPPGLRSGGRVWRFLSDQLAPVVVVEGGEQ